MQDEDEHRVWKDRRKNGQFKPGVSGNPSGRPKKSLSTESVFRAMLLSRVPVVTGGTRSTMTVVEAMAERTKREALTGPLRGLEKGINVAQRYGLVEPPVEKGDQFDYSALSDEELDLLEAILRKAAGHKSDDQENPSEAPFSNETDHD